MGHIFAVLVIKPMLSVGVVYPSSTHSYKKILIIEEKGKVQINMKAKKNGRGRTRTDAICLYGHRERSFERMSSNILLRQITFSEYLNARIVG